MRAAFDEATIRVYQAYRSEIADAALAQGTLGEPFSMSRMAWVKPSFMWMMYRSGWGQKDPGQARVLAIDITREGFEWALAHSCPSDIARTVGSDEASRLLREAPVRIQWDPERDLRLQRLPYRSIQIGRSGEAVKRYVQDWITRITDMTEAAEIIGTHVGAGRLDAAVLLPEERTYPLSPELAEKIDTTRWLSLVLRRGAFPPARVVTCERVSAAPATSDAMPDESGYVVGPPSGRRPSRAVPWPREKGSRDRPQRRD